MQHGKMLIVAGSLVLASGCVNLAERQSNATFIGDYRSKPTVYNQYTGGFIHGPLVDPNTLQPFMEGRCSAYGGLDATSARSDGGTLLGSSPNGVLGLIYKYRCNGPSASPVRQELNAAPSQQEAERVRAESEAAKKGRELEEQLRQARQQQAVPVQAVAPPTTDRLSLDASKKKCADLGFKPSTEGFGKCVLQLSK